MNETSGVTVRVKVGKDTPPLAAIRGIRECLAGVESSLTANVARARLAGHSWQEIAEALGTSKQSAWERYAKAEEEERAREIDSVIGSLKGRLAMTTDEMREEARREEREIDERKKREILGGP